MSSSTTIVGNTVRDWELTYTPAGKAVGKVGVAVNRRYKKGDEWQEETSFLNVVVWGEQAENAAESMPKGTRVMVSGRLEQRSWESPDGEKRSTVEIVADEVAASVKWATVAVQRTERVTAGASAGGGRGGMSGLRDSLGATEYQPGEEAF